MKKYLLILLLFSTSAVADDGWYRVNTKKGAEVYSYYGKVDKTPEEFAKSLVEEDVIKITELVFFDNRNSTPKSWQEWFPYLVPEVYIRSSEIIAFFPMMGDPRQ